MYGKAFAPEYQGALTALSVNSSLDDVLAAGTEQLRAAERAGRHGEAARSGLAVAEAQRRLGRVADADRTWKASYRAARRAGDTAAPFSRATPCSPSPSRPWPTPATAPCACCPRPCPTWCGGRRTTSCS
jgi:hypothetical protein